MKLKHCTIRGGACRSSRELGIARNTVRKYLRLDESAISRAQENRSRSKRLDEHRDSLIHQLKAYPQLRTVKLARRLREKVGEHQPPRWASDRHVNPAKF